MKIAIKGKRWPRKWLAAFSDLFVCDDGGRVLARVQAYQEGRITKVSVSILKGEAEVLATPYSGLGDIVLTEPNQRTWQPKVEAS